MGKAVNLKHVGRRSWLHHELPVLGQVTLLVTQYPSCKTGLRLTSWDVVRGGLWTPLLFDVLSRGSNKK